MKAIFTSVRRKTVYDTHLRNFEGNTDNTFRRKIWSQKIWNASSKPSTCARCVRSILLNPRWKDIVAAATTQTADSSSCYQHPTSGKYPSARSSSRYYLIFSGAKFIFNASFMPRSSEWHLIYNQLYSYNFLNNDLCVSYQQTQQQKQNFGSNYKVRQNSGNYFHHCVFL